MKKTTERDKGFAWVILVITYLHNVISASVFVSAAIYMVDWIEEFDITKAEVTLAGSIYGGVACFTGIFAGPLINRFGCIKVSIVGTTIAVIGLILTSFATSIWWIYISYGVLVGIGHAFYFIAPVLTVQYYFDKKRALASGLSLAGHSSGSFIMLPLLNQLVRIFGWRGAMLLHAGIVMQLYIFSSFYRKPNIPDLTDGTKTEDSANQENINIDRKKRNYAQKTLSFIKKTWNCSILQNPVFIQYLLSFGFAQMAIDMMYKFSSIKAVVAGIDRMRASFLPSIIGLASTCTRLVISFVANLKCVNRTVLCGAAVFGQGCTVILSCFAWNFESLIVSMVLFGVFLGTHMTLATTVTVDLLGIGNLANAQSFISGIVSISMVSGLTFTGLMVDLTGDYDLPNYVYGSLEMFAGVLVLAIPLTQRLSRNQVGSLEGKSNQQDKKENVLPLKYQKNKENKEEVDGEHFANSQLKQTARVRLDTFQSVQSLTSISGQ